MVPFIVVFIFLILLNAALLLFSSRGMHPRISTPDTNTEEEAGKKMYPLESFSSNYKKAI